MGTRISEETDVRPKPMVGIGGRPILWHIMKIYERFGFNDFVLALGYKGEVIKDYFINYHSLSSNIAVHLKSGKVTYNDPTAENWTVRMYDTGKTSMTGGRLRRLAPHIGDGPFMLTYGDGVADVDINELVKFHRKHKRLATITAVRPPARFGILVIENGCVTEFKEKPQMGEGWINGGFMVLEPGVFDYLEGDETIFEEKPLENLARDGQLMAYQHEGFWHAMDTLRDKNYLDGLCASNKTPWMK